MPPVIDLDEYRFPVFLTGAGVSVASGLRPYRGSDGLWNDEELVKYAHVDTFSRDPLGVWWHWWRMRELALAASPNAAHLALAGLEAARPAGSRFALITQNVDGLHSRAGGLAVVEYHGSVLRTRCSKQDCGLPPFRDECRGGEAVPACPRCGAPLRPDIVLFGEAIPRAQAKAAEDALGACDLFVAVGTSATVYPAAGFAELARRGGARTIYLALEPLGVLGGEGPYGEEILGRAEELLPALFRPLSR